ncbi:hypothetical protein WJX73_000580 [Symbiochloris irregularis]|uniref:Uncharacterized protein n=1 Tax=Symbiochloris irregularis TaxID=706552 RepID=A0AAW1NX68_9CHLO
MKAPKAGPETPPRREQPTSVSLVSPLNNGAQPELAMGPSTSDLSEPADITNALRKAAASWSKLPSIFRRTSPGSRDIEEVLGVQVADWSQVKRCGHSIPPRRGSVSKRRDLPNTPRQAVQKASKVSKSKGANPGRTYTSKYRGVHQTFPTKRWEAQFRRNGKPTSLGCFDLEQEAARAYDKMMLWCELHQSSGMKGGITNFDPTEYERDLAHLQNVSQEELVQSMRSEGRKQATHRMMRQKRDGQLTHALMHELDTIMNASAAAAAANGDLAAKATQQRSPGDGKVTLATLTALVLPALVYSHALSTSPTDSRYKAQPDDVVAWNGVLNEIRDFAAGFDNTVPCYQAPAPTGIRNEFLISSEGGVNTYLRAYLYDIISTLPSPPGIFRHFIVEHYACGGLLGDTDYVAVSHDADNVVDQLLLALESTTRATFPVPTGKTVAEMWLEPTAWAGIQLPMEQIYGYMSLNGLRYGLITSGELFVLLERNGSCLKVAELRNDNNDPSPTAAIYWLLHRGAEAPGRLLKQRPKSTSDEMDFTLPRLGPDMFLWSMLQQALWWAASWWACRWLLAKIRQLLPPREAWAIEALGLSAQIDRGRTGPVFEGLICKQRVAVKIGDIAANKKALAELQHERNMYHQLAVEQGRCVPRLVASGFIEDSTLYFLATELLGTSLEDTEPEVADALEPAALRALERLHSHGVLHRDVRASNFLRCGQTGVRLIDLAFAEATVNEDLLQTERKFAPAKLRSHRHLQLRRAFPRPTAAGGMRPAVPQ